MSQRFHDDPQRRHGCNKVSCMLMRGILTPVAMLSRPAHSTGGRPLLRSVIGMGARTPISSSMPRQRIEHYRARRLGRSQIPLAGARHFRRDCRVPCVSLHQRHLIHVQLDFETLAVGSRSNTSSSTRREM